MPPSHRTTIQQVPASKAPAIASKKKWLPVATTTSVVSRG
jgi:hypothetical protein